MWSQQLCSPSVPPYIFIEKDTLRCAYEQRTASVLKHNLKKKEKNREGEKKYFLLHFIILILQMYAQSRITRNEALILSGKKIFTYV